MEALRDGWLLEENRGGVARTIPCLRLALDQTGTAGRQDRLHRLASAGRTALPVYGEIAVDGEINFDGGRLRTLPFVIQ